MSSTFSFGKARHTFQRWLVGEKKSLRQAIGGVPTVGDERGTSPSSRHETQDERISRFMEELKASQQEWLCRVRMIRFDAIRKRVGSKWAKLRDRVEIAAERIIKEELSEQDRHLNLGDAEFLVFFAGATPEESRIRCLAIVEAIHNKLFGFDNSFIEPGRRLAECHVAHRDDFILAWEAAHSPTRHSPNRNSPTKVLRPAFRANAEHLDGVDIAASAQTVIDSIIARSAESKNLQQLIPAVVRLKYLSGSLKTLDAASVAERADSLSAQIANSANADQLFGGNICKAGDPHHRAMDMAWDDIAELISVLDVGPNDSHGDLLSTLHRLRRERLARATKALADEDSSSRRLDAKVTEGRTFEYLPVYRSVCRGERIHQGIYRVNCCDETEIELSVRDDWADLKRQRTGDRERATLEHAIQYVLDRRTSTQCMLMVAVPIETLRSPHSQRRFSVVLRSAHLRAKRRLLMEVVDYGEDDNTIATRRAIEELRVHSLAVFVRFSHKALSSFQKMAEECRQLGVHAIGIDVSPFHGRDAVAMRIMDRAFSFAERCSMPVYINGIDNIPIFTHAVARGASYLCAPALRPAQPAPQDADLATLDDLYSVV
jgi:GGDEF domain-containing protein